VIDAARQALYASMITSYAQGMAMLGSRPRSIGYGIDPARSRRSGAPAALFRASCSATSATPSSATPAW
jgi:6-phosphogluconate dehydrogenase